MASSKKKDVRHDIKKVVKRIGHEIKENTELAEHETGVDNTKSTFNKIKKAIKQKSMATH
jgi:hypothetical protein